MKAVVASAKARGLPKTELGFTDNTRSDYASFLKWFPSLSDDVVPTELPRPGQIADATLPPDVAVHTCSSPVDIQAACTAVLDALMGVQEKEGGSARLFIGFGLQRELSPDPDSGGFARTTLIGISLKLIVYLLRVCNSNFSITFSRLTLPWIRCSRRSLFRCHCLQ
jgi:hypothetical protein